MTIESTEQAHILESGTPDEILEFALNAKGADIDALQNRILEIGDLSASVGAAGNPKAFVCQA